MTRKSKNIGNFFKKYKTLHVLFYIFSVHLYSVKNSVNRWIFSKRQRRRVQCNFAKKNLRLVLLHCLALGLRIDGTNSYGTDCKSSASAAVAATAGAGAYSGYGRWVVESKSSRRLQSRPSFWGSRRSLARENEFFHTVKRAGLMSQQIIKCWLRVHNARQIVKLLSCAMKY